MTTTTTEAFEAHYQRSAEDPASAEMLAIWEAAWNAATERAAKQERPTMLSADDMADLERLNEVFNDGEGWDLPKERMKRLADLGIVRWHGVTRYSITSFGRYCLSEFELPLSTLEEYNAKAYAEMLERNGIDAAASIGSGKENGNA